MTAEIQLVLLGQLNSEDFEKAVPTAQLDDINWILRETVPAEYFLFCLDSEKGSLQFIETSFQVFEVFSVIYHRLSVRVYFQKFLLV